MMTECFFVVKDPNIAFSINFRLKSIFDVKKISPIYVLAFSGSEFSLRPSFDFRRNEQREYIFQVTIVF